MDISTFNHLLLIVLAVVPGYIYERVKWRFVVTDSPPTEWQFKALNFVVHSMLMLAISWFFYIVSGSDLTDLLDQHNAAGVAKRLLASEYRWGTAVFVVPAIAGFLSALITRFNILAIPFRLFALVTRSASLNPLPAVVQAWDSVFLLLSSGKPRLLSIYLKDKTVVTGLFDKRSCATRSGGYKDIFLSQCYSVDVDGTMRPVERSDGCFVRGSDISWIHFLSMEDNEHGSDNVTVTRQGSRGDD